MGDNKIAVIGAGLPRTGATSTKAALERLGFGPCYHMSELIANPDHVDRWFPAVSGEPVDWDVALSGYRSTQDWPASFFWRELVDAYPAAKVVLTIRDPRQWYPSFRELMSLGLATAQSTGVPSERRAVFQRMHPLMDSIMRTTFGAEGVPEEGVAITAFERHVQRVQREVPANRLLVFDVRSGWEPLASFLGVPVPDSEPFPRLNDFTAMRQSMTPGE